MIIDLGKKESIAHYMLFSSVDGDTIDAIAKHENYDPEKVEMKLFVNGVQVDLSKFAKSLDESIDEEERKIEELKNQTRDELLYQFKLEKEMWLDEKLTSLIDEIDNIKNRSYEIVDRLYKQYIKTVFYKKIGG